MIFIFECLKLREFAALLTAFLKNCRAKMKNNLESGFGKTNIKANIYVLCGLNAYRHTYMLICVYIFFSRGLFGL